jgi:hypothetical protein
MVDPIPVLITTPEIQAPQMTGWWLVSWDDDIPNVWKVIQFMFQTTNPLKSIKIH